MEAEKLNNSKFNSLSLNKAAYLLGCNELNKFDYKSLVSIRKLAKTLGCNEYDLMKSFDNNSNNNSHNETNDINKISEKKLNLGILKRKKLFSQSKSKNKFKDNERTFKRTIINKKLPSKYSNIKVKKNQLCQTNEESFSDKNLVGKDNENLLNKESNNAYLNQQLKTSPKREVILYRDENLGFGFIAGSEKPLKIRFVTPDGPGSNKLLNGDEILAINDEDVEFASRNYVINLIRSCTDKIKLVVKQPTPKSNNSLLLTEDKKALKKEINSNKVIKVRFRLEDNLEVDNNLIDNNEKIQLNLIKNDLDLNIQIFRVNLENQIVKSFKYDSNTTVKDVLQCLKEKLSIKTIEYFGLVVRILNDIDCVSKYILIDETQYLYKIKERFGDKMFCMLRFVFIPNNFRDLATDDEYAFRYLFEQSLNDVLKEKYASEIKYEMILHLSTLSILYDLYDSLPNYFSSFSADFEDRIEVENYLPKSILDSNILPKDDLKNLLTQNIMWFFEKANLISNKKNIMLEYLNCMKELFQFSGRIFFVFLLDQMKEAFIIIGAEFGIASFVDIKSKTLLSLAKFESIENIRVSNSLSLNLNLIRVDLDLFETITDDNEIIKNKTISFGFLKDDFAEFLYILQGYLRLVVYPLKNNICPIQEIKPSDQSKELNVPAYLIKHPCRVSDQFDEEETLNNGMNSMSLNTEVEELNETIESVDSVKEINTEQLNSDNDLKQQEQNLPIESVIKPPNSNGFNLKEELHKELMKKFLSKKESENKKVIEEEEEEKVLYFANSSSSNSNLCEEPIDDCNNTEKVESEKSFRIIKNEDDYDEDSKSLSSIEGSLKGISSTLVQNSSTPLIHLYPNIQEIKIGEESEWKSIEFDELNSEKKEIKLSVESENMANLNYELNMENFNGDKIEGDLDECNEETFPTIVRNFNLNSTKTRNYDFGNFDVIDLTQSFDKTLILVPPPPEQFSDDYQLNEYKPHEQEIESGIESDSSSDHNNIGSNIQFFNKIPPPPPTTPAPSLSPKTNEENISNINTSKEETDQINSKFEEKTSNNEQEDKSSSTTTTTYSSKLIINLDNNNKIQNRQVGIETTDPSDQPKTSTKLTSLKYLVNNNNNTQQYQVQSFRLNSTNLKRSNSFLSNLNTKMNDSQVFTSYNSLHSSSTASSSGVSSSSSSPTTSKPLTHSLSVKTIAKNYETSLKNNSLKVEKDKRSLSFGGNSIVKIINHSKPSDSLLPPSRLKSFSISSHEHLTKAQAKTQVNTYEKIQLIPNQQETNLLDKLFPNNNNNNSNQKDTKTPCGTIKNEIDDSSKCYESVKIAFSNDLEINNVISESITDGTMDSKKPIIEETITDNKKTKNATLSSLHKVFNRFVDSNKSKKDTSDDDKFEPINGYDDLYSTIKKSNKKRSISSFKSIENKLNRKASASYSSIYNSLPSRNFKSILDLFRHHPPQQQQQNKVQKNYSLDNLNRKVKNDENKDEIKFTTNENHSENIVSLFKNLNLIENEDKGVVDEPAEEDLSEMMTSTTEISVPILTTFKQVAQKKSLLKDPNCGKSSLKVRWKDSIEISNILIEKVSDEDDEKVEGEEDINDIYDDDYEMEDSDESIESSDLELNTSASKLVIDKKASREIETAYSNIEEFNLKPLHKIGKEFENEMMERIFKLEKIAENKFNNEENSKSSDQYFNEIFSDLDIVLVELHSTIEHVRLSSMITNLEQLNEDTIENDIFKRNLEDNLNEIALICREFVHYSKTMISSALIDDQAVLPNVRTAMNSLSLLVKTCFQVCFKYMYKNEKLDEIRQLLIQILNLLNTFRNTLNISFLASTKQLNDTQMDLLMKQAQCLANEISLLIKYFKLIY
ncbi:unnamed protein product [Brachionus calyciflorus]|uniref:PDZ domain-containing protein n=1 Tax=Brachionus calyciflorus TaxID=104777 RepID=A0A813MBF0_9BILA|nr:unnamed protein product [Brachionus calyciflorus]